MASVRSWAATCGSTPTISSTRTAAPTISPPGGMWSTGPTSVAGTTARKGRERYGIAAGGRLTCAGLHPAVHGRCRRDPVTASWEERAARVLPAGVHEDLYARAVRLHGRLRAVRERRHRRAPDQ